MATTDELQCSEETICTLLLPQLLEIWLPDYDAAHHESCATPSSEPAPTMRIPPLIAFLEGLSDAVTPNESFPRKRMPCGHVVYLRAILACCNLLGDATWTSAPSKFRCADPECEDTMEFPRLPNPRVLDGLAVRLDLIEWSWEINEPTKPDRDVVRLLRDILSTTGHMAQEPEPETHAEASPPKASENSLKQTLVHVEIEASAMMLADGEMRAETPARGTEPYCSYRAATIPQADPSQLRYPTLSPGQECDCVTPHEFVREARKWSLTPAETPLLDGNGDDEEAKDDAGSRKKPKKTVRFAGPVVVTQVRYFEPWWCDEYRDSDRYWSNGPFRLSTDPSTAEDDEWEIEMMGDSGLLAAERARAATGQGSESESDEWDEEWAEEVRLELEKRLRESAWEEDTDVEDEE